MSTTVMMIHGAWLTPTSWDGFRARYEAQGYPCVAPAWPYEERPVAELRRAPAPELAGLGVREIVDHYAALIRKLPEPPILIGHSFGGLFVQMLLDRGLGAVGVAIDPGVPRGVPPGLITLRSSLPVFLAWKGWKRVLTMSYESFASGFAQLLPEAEKRAAYERYIVPAPGRIFFQAAFGVGTKVDYASQTRAPLLLIAGEKDRTVQESMVRGAYRKHGKSPVETGFKSFPGRTHWLMNEQGWEEVADYAIDWAAAHSRAKPALAGSAG